MPDEERLRLEAIAERIALVRTWAEEMEEAAFLADPMARDAVAMRQDLPSLAAAIDELLHESG